MPPVNLWRVYAQQETSSPPGTIEALTWVTRTATNGSNPNGENLGGLESFDFDTNGDIIVCSQAYPHYQPDDWVFLRKIKGNTDDERMWQVRRGDVSDPTKRLFAQDIRVALNNDMYLAVGAGQSYYTSVIGAWLDGTVQTTENEANGQAVLKQVVEQLQGVGTGNFYYTGLALGANDLFIGGPHYGPVRMSLDLQTVISVEGWQDGMAWDAQQERWWGVDQLGADTRIGYLREDGGMTITATLTNFSVGNEAAWKNLEVHNGVIYITGRDIIGGQFADWPTTYKVQGSSGTILTAWNWSQVQAVPQITRWEAGYGHLVAWIGGDADGKQVFKRYRMW